jgi:hypothetical protein
MKSYITREPDIVAMIVGAEDSFQDREWILVPQEFERR